MKKVSRFSLVYATLIAFALAVAATLHPVTYYLYLILFGGGFVGAIAVLGALTTIFTINKDFTLQVISEPDYAIQNIANSQHVWYNCVSVTTSSSLGIFLAFYLTGMVGLLWVAVIYCIGGALLANGNYRIYKFAKIAKERSSNE